MNDLSYIYTLNDPDTDQVMYVGKAKNPASRLYAHKSGYGQTRKDKWVKQLHALGKQPVMKIADRCLPEQASKVEQEWIAAYSGLCPQLTNTMGGSLYVRRPQVAKFLADNTQSDSTCYRCKKFVNFEDVVVTCVSPKEIYWTCTECHENRQIVVYTRDDWD